jgi:hypothetical protein
MPDPDVGWALPNPDPTDLILTHHHDPISHVLAIQTIPRPLTSSPFFLGNSIFISLLVTLKLISSLKQVWLLFPHLSSSQQSSQQFFLSSPVIKTSLIKLSPSVHQLCQPSHSRDCMCCLQLISLYFVWLSLFFSLVFLSLLPHLLFFALLSCCLAKSCLP